MFFSFFQFLNYYSFEVEGSYNFEEYTKTLTRGGPLAKNPSGYYFNLEFNSDDREEVSFGADFGYENNKLKWPAQI